MSFARIKPDPVRVIEELPYLRNEGFVATNKLTGGYLAHHHTRRTLVAWVKAKARDGMFVNISYVANGGAESLLQTFQVKRAITPIRTLS